MIIPRLFKFSGIFFLFTLFLVSCKNEKRCNEFMYSPLQLHFYKAIPKEGYIYVKDSSLSKIVFNIGNLTDTLINAKNIFLPLSPLSDSIAFELSINNQPADIVYVKYNPNRLFINYECGFRYDYTLDTLVSVQNRFDSIDIVKPYVTVNDEVHIKIYLHTADNSSN